MAQRCGGNHMADSTEVESTVIDFPQPDPHDPFSSYNTPRSPILFPVGQRPVGWQQRDGSYQRTSAHKAIIRLSPKGDSAILLNVVGATYKLVHNRELFSKIE